jgi:hypothetical protein
MGRGVWLSRCRVGRGSRLVSGAVCRLQRRACLAECLVCVIGGYAGLDGQRGLVLQQAKVHGGPASVIPNRSLALPMSGLN